MAMNYSVTLFEVLHPEYHLFHGNFLAFWHMKVYSSRKCSFIGIVAVDAFTSCVLEFLF
jgi:hypothetical protein